MKIMEIITFPSLYRMVQRSLSPIFLIAKEYMYRPGSHIRYQLPISVPARRTQFEAMIRTWQPDSVIPSMLSRNKDEHITLQVSKSSQTVTA